MPPTVIRYDYPRDGLDPFDVTEPATQHVYFAGGWARGWVADHDVERSHPDLTEGIPMGYKALSVIEKLAVVVDGAIVARWDRTDTDDRGWRSSAERFRTAEPWTRPFWALSHDGAQFHGFDELSAALTHTHAHPQLPWVVGRPLEHRSWH